MKRENMTSKESSKLTEISPEESLWKAMVFQVFQPGSRHLAGSLSDPCPVNIDLLASTWVLFCIEISLLSLGSSNPLAQYLSCGEFRKLPAHCTKSMAHASYSLPVILYSLEIGLGLCCLEWDLLLKLLRIWKSEIKTWSSTMLYFFLTFTDVLECVDLGDLCAVCSRFRTVLYLV